MKVTVQFDLDVAEGKPVPCVETLQYHLATFLEPSSGEDDYVLSKPIVSLFGDEPAQDDTPMCGDMPGTEFWVTRDYGGEGKGLSLSKTTLGEFVYHLLKLGGKINSTWAMAPEYPRSYVQMSITIPAGRKALLEEASGITLEKPPTLRPA